MLYVFHGTDPIKARSKARSLVEGLLKRKPDASHFRLDNESFSKDGLLEYIQSKGLFSERYIVVLDHTFENEDAKNEVMQNLPAISDSYNIFVILEGKLDKKNLTKLEKYSEKSNLSNLIKGSEPGDLRFNIFSLTESFGRRDPKSLWSLYQKAIRSGVQPEEIHGIIFWQIKTALMVAKKDVTGIKPFVVSKTRAYLRNYSKEELEGLSTQMVTIYHEARRGGAPLEISLEKLVLGISRE